MVLGLLASCTSDVSRPEGWSKPGVLMVSGWTGSVHWDPGQGSGLVWERQPGPDDLTAEEVLVAPDTVEAREAFQVTTYTVGPSGCWRSDGQTVSTNERIVVLRPHDSHSGSEICTDALFFLAHGSTLVLTEAGEWTLRVDGRRLRLVEPLWEEPVSATKTIIVR
jgi:hypothetical protein